jgi:hypothetical protein
MKVKGAYQHAPLSSYPAKNGATASSTGASFLQWPHLQQRELL